MTLLKTSTMFPANYKRILKSKKQLNEKHFYYF